MKDTLRCGTCKHCQMSRKLQWRSRLLAEAATSTAWPVFFTLTYSNEYLPSSDDEAVYACQRLWRRMRKGGHSPRYFIATERGGLNGRLHHHGIAWIAASSYAAHGIREFFERYWARGFVNVSYVRNARAFGYAAKYISKDNYYQWSQKPMLGSEFVEDWAELLAERHARRPYRSMAEVPAFVRTNVLRTSRVIQIPQPAFLRTCASLGVQYAPEEARARLLKVVYEGVPNGPLDLQKVDAVARLNRELVSEHEYTKADLEDIAIPG